MYGWTGKRLKVYLTEGKIVEEETPEWLRKEYLGEEDSIPERSSMR